MKNFFVFILILMVLFFSKTTYSQFVRIANRVIIGGYIYDEKEKPLAFVNIYIKNIRIGTISDTTGHFTLTARLNDTLIISCLGYKTKSVFLSEKSKETSEPLILFMEAAVYELKSVNIIALQRKKQFEYDLINMKIEEDKAYNNALENFPFKPKDIDYYERGNSARNFAGIIVHPISALYDAFSKESKERRKLEEIKKIDDSKNFILSKMNYDIIKNITGMEQEQTNIFLYWCNFNAIFINSLSDYDLILLVNQKFTEYKLFLKEKNKFFFE